MKRMILLSLIIVLLMGCFYDKEAKKRKNDEAVQAAITTDIQKQAKENYGMDVNVQMNNLSFTYPEGKLLLPLKTDKRLEVPVEVMGDRSYTFKAYIPFYDEETDTYGLNDEDIDIAKLPHMATAILTDIFEALYEKELKQITAFDSGVELSVKVEDKFSGRYFENKQAERKLAMSFAKDYNEGKFTDPTHYLSLIRKHTVHPNKNTKTYNEKTKGMEPCTPTIDVNIEHQQRDEGTEKERFTALKGFIENDETLPNATYSVTVREADPEDLSDIERYHDLLIKCH